METSLIIPSLFISFLTGIKPVLYKQLLNDIDTKTLIIVGEFIYFACTVGFMAYYWKDVSKDYKNISINNLLIITILSISTAFLANVVYLKLLKDNHSYIVSALVSIAPVFTLVFAYLILKEELSKYGLIGFILIVIGVMFISFNKVIKNK